MQKALAEALPLLKSAIAAEDQDALAKAIKRADALHVDVKELCAYARAY